MNLRELTQLDIEFVKEHTASGSIFNKQPEIINYSYALEHEGKILAIGGIQLVNLTTAWGWIELTVYAKDHIKTVYKVIKEWMDEIVDTHKIRRLQAYVEADFERGIRMVKHLGFRWESDMPNFVGDKLAYMYVKFSGE